MNTPSNKLIISSGIFIVTFMMLDAILNDEFEKVPREIIGGLVLVLMLSMFDFIGLGRIAGPFATLIAGTVFLTRGGRIATKLGALSGEQDADGTGSQSGGSWDTPTQTTGTSSGGSF